MRLLSSLKHNKNDAVGLLQVGTFLEYFDLMLYVHMAVLLNELFFPKVDPHTTALLSAFAFCSTYVLRPVGALIFGFIGDYMGRKTTVIMTTIMMGISCMIMATLPTYAQIGITASWGVTICRILQGLSCQGEIIGAEIYLTEVTKPPLRYLVVSLTSFSASLGGMIALGLAIMLLKLEINWRMAFWIGAAISSIGLIARTQLQETSEFLRTKRLQKKRKAHPTAKNLSSASSSSDKINTSTFMAYFLISCGYPACFYLAYIHFGNVLKTTYHYTSEQVIQHNFILSVAQCLSFLVYSLLSYKINPLRILKFRLLIFWPIVLLYPYWLSIIHSPSQLLMFQFLIMVFGIMDVPAAGLMMNHFPTLKRFTSTSLIYAFSRMIIYLVTSFGFVYLTQAMSYYGIWLILAVLCLGFNWAIRYFENLEGLKDGSSFLEESARWLNKMKHINFKNKFFHDVK
ncbi:MFS transporter [Candidatus Odyssella acanthamoebae]|uniref:MFS transporter n=1 Tax=Candidatus Odyssella acanthamoebae TaxID=91604 RepID=UPI00094B788D|nr:MFS transporter [Candidatus Paracaedibacter acanthamoebae]